MSTIKGSYEDIAERYLLKPKATIDELKNGEKVNSIPFEVLRRIIEDDEYYAYAMKTFEHDFFFRMGVSSSKDIANILVFEKQDILNALADLLNSQRIMVTERARERFDNLCNTNTVSVNELRKKYIGGFGIGINGREHEFLYKDIFDVIEDPQSIESKNMSEEDKDDLLQTAQLFISKLIRDRNGSLVRTKINPKLREAIFEGMQDDFTLLERAIFIYIKLCKTLSYSDEAYSLWMLKEVTNKFEKGENISRVTPDNNETVCDQSDMILLRFLGELGVGLNEDTVYKIETNHSTDKHFDVFFIIGDCIINADPTLFLMHSDLTNAKFNARLEGLQCLSPEKEEQEKFGKALSKIYNIIQKQEKEKEDNKHRLDTFIEGYSLLTNNLRPVSIDERLDILIYSINSTGFKGIDAIGRMMTIKKNIFTKEQLKNNINMAAVRNLDTDDIRKRETTSVVVSINQIGFEESPDSTVYYIYNPGHPLEKISKEKVQIKCGIGTISYVEEKFKIPGIDNQELNRERLGI